MLTVNPGNIPDELKALRQWVLWLLEERNGRTSKVPYRPDGHRASSTNSADWTSFDHVWSTLSSAQTFNGLGFVFRKGGGIVGIDLDHVSDENGAVEAWALRTVKAFNSYTEFSVSGQGLHIICCGSIPDGKGHRHGQVEVYSQSRYFTVSGNVYCEPRPLREAQREIERLLAWIKESRQRDRQTTAKHSQNVRPPYVGRRGYLNNSEVLEKARAAKNGHKFSSLFDYGVVSGYPSHSEADLALLSHLFYWTNGDQDRASELFRQSALYRPKWDRFDYRERCFQILRGGRAFHE